MTKQEYMYGLVVDQVGSGVSQVAFCAACRVSLDSFKYWRRKYLREQAKHSSSQAPSRQHGFVPLHVETMPYLESVEILFPNGVKVYPNGWDADTTMRLIQSWRS